MKRTIKDWLLILALLLDEAAALVLLVLILWILDVQIPLPIIITVGLLLGALIFIVHKAVISTFRKKRITGSEGMVGLTGTVIEQLTPVGVVMVGSEYWKAKSVGGNIAVGEEVEILALNGLTLMVRLRQPDKEGE